MLDAGIASPRNLEEYEDGGSDVTFSIGMHPGTTWHKCDFQCHTPRDLAWSGSPELPGGDAAAENARNAWAESFIAAAEAAKLTAVAISDHHDVCMSAYVSEAAKRLGSTVRIFPAVEITCSDNAQCIAIFDPSTGIETQKLALSAAGNVLMSSEAAPKTCTIQPTKATVAEFVAAIQDEQYLKDSCIVLPHFSTEDDHKSLNEPGHHPRFASLPIDGVYIERPYSGLDATTLDKVRGKISDWGKRRRAIVATGDNRSADWQRLGKHDCWIKLGEHSIEALRQALLADEARIAFELPVTPTEYLVELRVMSSLTGPTPVTILFNDGFNALIGGRGSGKSAFLEYLRFGLGRTDKDLNTVADPANDREVNLIKQTLSGSGYVEVVLEREGVRETWKRATSNQEAISITSPQGTIEVTTSTARERFRARAFRQKGLSSTMNDPVTASEQITSIAAAEELDQQRNIERSIKNAQRDARTALSNLAALWQARVDSQQAKNKVEDVRQRLMALSARMEQEGVSAEALTTIEEAPKYARAGEFIAGVALQAQETITGIGELDAAVLNIDISAYEGVVDFEEIAELQKALVETKATIAEHLAKAKLAGTALLNHQKTASEAFTLKRSAFDVRYATALAEQSKHKTLIDEVTRLTRELQTAETSLTKARADETGKAGAEKAYEEALVKLDALVQDRRKILKAAADKVAGKSSNLLKARIRKDQMPEEYLASLYKLFEASHTQQVEESCQDWIKAVLAENEDSGWATLRKSFLGLYEAKIMAGSPPDASDGLLSTLQSVIFKGSRNLTDRQQKKIYSNLTDAVVAGVISATPKDTINMSYIDEGRAIDFRMASPGQQASALLELLLKQAAGTLIIDQPEDDLDNRVIMRIVELLRRSKANRQLIFTTHNANIVVNGDADKIVTLKSPEPTSNPSVNAPRVQIDCDGAIETPSVGAAITSVMEGGREAFDLRSRKYRFDLAS
ncbi:chromosome segregation protein [Bradyrhizobium japonicum]|nr:AAA family ATPase [Bradyrhizobium elkanii]MCP1737477.1 AAA15 family ATPase/GTPase [Bradyrhizobium elkanii]MCS3576034.1 AAA15 family ATPase/GTPase [Bradyrhizobium elkanii]MCS3594629.1 AAA15 family ATPase/GTPase [Bradyrhizobium elkanii]MCS3625823.1 AAA15 family ATPase/GTPase [Bradyrhizobium elkanii]WLA96260.1 AAA family ATPase [Bradyrhizobium elkanii]